MGSCLAQKITYFPISLKSKCFYYGVIGLVDLKFTEIKLYIHLDLSDPDLDFWCLDQKLVLPVAPQPFIQFRFFQRNLTPAHTKYLKVQQDQCIFIMVCGWTGFTEMTQIVSGTMFGPQDLPLPIKSKV